MSLAKTRPGSPLIDPEGWAQPATIHTIPPCEVTKIISESG